MNPTPPTSSVAFTLLEILKYTLPAIIVLAASYLIVKKFLVSELQRKQIALLRESQDVTQRMRLQAYERLILYTERIHPRNLPGRIYEKGMSAAEFAGAMHHVIRAEWEHNVSQQLYVSRGVWETLRGVKEQEISMISQLASQLPDGAPAADLLRRMVDAVLSESGELPAEVAQQIIHEEARKILTMGAVG